MELFNDKSIKGSETRNKNIRVLKSKGFKESVAPSKSGRLVLNQANSGSWRLVFGKESRNKAGYHSLEKIYSTKQSAISDSGRFLNLLQKEV